MIDREEFLATQGDALGAKIDGEWLQAADRSFLAFFIWNHGTLGEEHLTAAMYLLRDFDSAEYRARVARYVDSPVLAVRALARAVFNHQQERGFVQEPLQWLPENSFE